MTNQSTEAPSANFAGPTSMPSTRPVSSLTSRSTVALLSSSSSSALPP
eukprot:CAMPEP_0177394324 /NCGR_PEP_ID=MMETSP0368-20130122/55471_1 /TAXON_ID=447022 ORGANISM="Scrippsiella hangoei-like, Strain SHHI-4" /NCGR_SAMPLE_ID=MMETSP0368 /ASSEMBLY_ACC=CAM_ASM_000363 /LENGTH=47 /DNA_ID= /DNA_START= /DNA_END= /DNA_ORIENTATION=